MSIVSIENVSFTPSKAVIYNQLFVPTNENELVKYRGVSSLLPKSNSQNGVISNRSANRLKDKINWLVFKSKKQKVKYPNGTISTNFRISFITLTLPSAQSHSDLEIKSIFNNFLTTLRKRFGMVDYVWKAELQANENIHFHLTTNIYLHHAVIRSIWNNAIERLGYVSRYQKKFSNMSFEKYRQIRLSNARKKNISLSEAKIQKSYNDGVKNKWSNPNSTDVKTVFKVESLAAYLAKYLSKQTAKNQESKSMVKRVASFGGNLWYCSRSLSRLSSYKSVMCNKYHSFISALSRLKCVMVKSFDYCTVIYFDIKKLPKFLKVPLERLLFSYIANPVL